MYFQQFYLGCLSHASYMLASEGIAAVVDPQRDVEIYIEEARKQGFRIGVIIETHLHADFVSGHSELAQRTGAKIYLGAKAGAKFPHVAVRDGDEIALGLCRLRFLETPGHSLDSISVLVTDLERSSEPFAVLTGDTLFIGDVGRPDLNRGRTAEEMAGLLYESLRKLRALPDTVEVYPAHGAGSLCGKQLGWERSSTIGKEKAANYAFHAHDKGEFVRLITADQPERPEYFQQDRELNRAGAAALSDLPLLTALKPAEILRRQSEGAIVLDTRHAVQFGSAHIPGSIHIGLSGQYASWAGTLIGLNTDLILLAEDEKKVEESRVRLARVGIERIAGYVEGGIRGWIGAGSPAGQVPQISVGDLHQAMAADPHTMQLLDVRRPSEWDSGHIPGAHLIPLHELVRSPAGLDQSTLTAVHCQTGYRSSIAASLLLRAGFKQVANVVGGFEAWAASKYPVVRTGAVAG